jgi:hypothetical protein
MCLNWGYNFVTCTSVFVLIYLDSFSLARSPFVLNYNYRLYFFSGILVCAPHMLKGTFSFSINSIPYRRKKKESPCKVN